MTSRGSPRRKRWRIPRRAPERYVGAGGSCDRSSSSTPPSILGMRCLPGEGSWSGSPGKPSHPRTCRGRTTRAPPRASHCSTMTSRPASSPGRRDFWRGRADLNWCKAPRQVRATTAAAVIWLATLNQVAADGAGRWPGPHHQQIEAGVSDSKMREDPGQDPPDDRGDQSGSKPGEKPVCQRGLARTRRHCGGWRVGGPRSAESWMLISRRLRGRRVIIRGRSAARPVRPREQARRGLGPRRPRLHHQGAHALRTA